MGGSGQVSESGPGPEGFNTAQVTARERRALMAGEEAGWKPGSQWAGPVPKKVGGLSWAASDLATGSEAPCWVVWWQTG